MTSQPENKPIYDLDPLDTPSAPDTKPPQPAPSSKPDPLSEKPSLLDDFDEDADFAKDPEVEAAEPKAARRKPKFAQADVLPAPGETLVVPGRGPAKPWAIVGAVLTLAALIFCAINSSSHPVINSLLVIYNALVHSVTGVVALAITATALGLKLGPLDLAAARMFVCVSAFLLCANLNIKLIGDSKLEELTCATLAYVALLWFLFRLDFRRLGTVAFTHFMLWMVLWVGMALSQSVGKAP